MDPWIIVPVSIIVIVCIIMIVIRIERIRRAALKEKAMTLGFSYTPKAGVSEIISAQEFHLFNIGHNRKIKNMMQRTSDGMETRIYDYQYTTGGGQSSHTHIQTIFQFQSERLRLPSFILRPENVFHKIGQSFGYQDIDFESFPEFSDRYLLRGNDEALIRKLFNQEVITFFKSEKGIVVEGNNHVLIAYRTHKRVKPDDLFECYEKMRQIFSLFLRRCDYV